MLCAKRVDTVGETRRAATLLWVPAVDRVRRNLRSVNCLVQLLGPTAVEVVSPES